MTGEPRARWWRLAVSKALWGPAMVLLAGMYVWDLACLKCGRTPWSTPFSSIRRRISFSPYDGEVR